MPQQQMGGFNQMPQQQQQGFGASQAAAQAATLQSMGMPQQSSMLGGINQMGGGSQSAAPQQQLADFSRQDQYKQQQMQGFVPDPQTMSLYNQLGNMPEPTSQAENMQQRQRRQAIVQQMGGEDVLAKYSNYAQMHDPQYQTQRQQQMTQQMPGNPYAQQMRQEDPRMQAMRYMQRMNFGGGGGYNF